MQEVPTHAPSLQGFCSLSYGCIMGKPGPTSQLCGFNQTLWPSASSVTFLTLGMQLAYKFAEQTDDQQARKAPGH